MRLGPRRLRLLVGGVLALALVLLGLRLAPREEMSAFLKMSHQLFGDEARTIALRQRRRHLGCAASARGEGLRLHHHRDIVGIFRTSRGAAKNILGKDEFGHAAMEA